MKRKTVGRGQNTSEEYKVRFRGECIDADNKIRKPHIDVAGGVQIDSEERRTVWQELVAYFFRGFCKRVKDRSAFFQQGVSSDQRV